MLKKLFGKKDNNYFLEIEEKPETKTETTESSKENTDSTTIVEKVETKTVKQPKSKSQKTAKKPIGKTKSTPTYEPPEWVKAIKNYSDVQSSEATQGKSPFADRYLMKNTPLSRRKPGASLNSFKQMASTMKKK